MDRDAPCFCRDGETCSYCEELAAAEEATEVHGADGVEMPGRTLRILDLGGHDGYVSAYVIDQLTGDGTQLHVDGVELNPKACEIANRRLAERGITGTFKQGLAEQAPELFDVGTYDAVVAFELIEHVIDMAGFLQAAEAMTKVGGRVYVSTPDGCFGSGQNPNHLRVLPIRELVDMVRRRGNIQSAIVGHDTIGVVAYTPEPGRERLGDVAIYCGPAIKHWSPLDIERPGVGLGGSETAAARLAEALDAIGYTVTVYAECDEGFFGQVIFRHHTVFDPLEARRAVILSRTPHLLDRPVDAPARVLWMHDTDYGTAVTDERVVHASALMVLSEWHFAHVAALYPFAVDKLVKTSNGIQPAYFGTNRPASSLVSALSPESEDAKLTASVRVLRAPDESKGEGSLPTGSEHGESIPGIPDVRRSPFRAIFSSSPDRGLDFLVRIWPRIRALTDGQAELVCCYPSVYDDAAAAMPELQAFREKLTTAIAETENVFNLGPLAQPELAAVMERCGVWLNPGYNGVFERPFFETYCIGAVEAAAAGCRIVAGAHGALAERVNVANAWELVTGLTPDPVVWEDAIVEAMHLEAATPTEPSGLALEQTWAQTARDFHAVIAAHPA